MADEDVTSSGGGFSKKIAGVPLWGWSVGIGGLAVGIWWWRKKNAASSTQQSNTDGTNPSGATSNTTPTNSSMSTEQYESLLALLRDIQGEEGSIISKLPSQSSTPTMPGPPVPAQPPGAPPKSGSPQPGPQPTSPRTVTVNKSPAWNSTLWGIAQRYYGDGSQYDKIYEANKAMILQEETKHGMTQAQAADRKWLYPGEKLVVP
jgi:nucleoid-associated protein YgaU